MSRRHSYQIYPSNGDYNKTLINRKMLILVDLRQKPVYHMDGHILIFYKNRDANLYIIKKKKQDVWRIKKIQLDATII